MISLLGSLTALRQATKPEPKSINVEGRPIPLVFRRNKRCRRMVLRLAPDGAGVVMTLPSRTSMAEAMRFAETSIPWIARTIAKRPSAVPFQPESQVLFQGQLYTIKATGGRRGLVTFSEAELTITVPGDLAHVPRRLTDWLKAQAKVKFQVTSQLYAEAMHAKFKKLAIRDQKSRWGSCSAAGDLSYSWRLILAPPEVLNYVAAHEVAHLKEMNHGPRFWRLVIAHCKTAKEARRWLRENGRELHRYGASGL
jgi:predicted metal-dependent hydrolase